MRAAVEARQPYQALPVNVKYRLEGDQQIGSAHLPSLIESNQDEVAYNVVLICDTAAFRSGCPPSRTARKSLCTKRLR